MRTAKKNLLSDDEEDEADELTRHININLSYDEDKNENTKSVIQRIETEKQSCEIVDLLASKLIQGILW